MVVVTSQLSLSLSNYSGENSHGKYLLWLSALNKSRGKKYLSIINKYKMSCLNIASHHLKIEINSDMLLFNEILLFFRSDLRAIMLLFTKFKASCIFDRGLGKT